MVTTNFIKKIVDKAVSEEDHNAFTRYSLGEFVKEPFTLKTDKNGLIIKGGFEYVNFFHQFLAENVREPVQVEGVIESVHDLGSDLKKIGVQYEEDRRFGKSGKKFVLSPQKVSPETYKKMVKEFFADYLLFNVIFSGGELKLKKKTTPKLGSPTKDFIKIKVPDTLVKAFQTDYLFDIDSSPFKQLAIEQTYAVHDIDVDLKLLQKDANLARKKAFRSGEIKRKITVDGKVVKEYIIKFKV